MRRLRVRYGDAVDRHGKARRRRKRVPQTAQDELQIYCVAIC